MRLNDALNLVFPVGDAQVHHTPITREVFEANYRILAATRAALSGKGVMYQMYAGPRIAKLALLDEAKADAEERGLDVDASGALLAEIKRLTMIVCATPEGFKAMPVDAAIHAGKIDAEDWAEAESALVFFTCVLSMESRSEKPKIAQATASLLKGSITSSSASEFAASLPASTMDAPSAPEISAAPSFPM